MRDKRSSAEGVVTVDDALALVRAHSRPRDGEVVDLGSALGRVLREMVVLEDDQPAFDRSAMDGYAVRVDDTAVQFQVVDRIRAGDWRPRVLGLGEAVQVATGAAVPGPGLQVVPREDAHEIGGVVGVLRRTPASHIRLRGEDAKAGTVLLGEGLRLGAGGLALLASVGWVRPRVTRRVRALHVATGNEIVPPHASPAPGQVRDSNSTLVAAFLAREGVTVRQVWVPEDAGAAEARLREPAMGLDAVDLLLISGGASVGEHDFTRPMLERLGYTIRIRQVWMRPGKPMLFGTRGAAAAFGLPGNPLSHFVCLNLFVRAALAGLRGEAARPWFAEGRLAAEIQAGANPRETLWPARLELAGGGARLEPLPWSNSGDLTPVAAANALVRVPARVERLERDAVVAFQGLGD